MLLILISVSRGIFFFTIFLVFLTKNIFENHFHLEKPKLSCLSLMYFLFLLFLSFIVTIILVIWNVLHVLSQGLRNPRFYLVIITHVENTEMCFSNFYNFYNGYLWDYTCVHANTVRWSLKRALTFELCSYIFYLNFEQNVSRPCTESSDGSIVRIRNVRNIGIQIYSLSQRELCDNNRSGFVSGAEYARQTVSGVFKCEFALWTNCIFQKKGKKKKKTNTPDGIRLLRRLNFFSST